MAKQKTKLKQTEIGKIPEDWGIKTMGDICEKIIDCSHAIKPQFLDKSDYIFLEVGNIGNDGFLDLKNVKYVSNKDYLAWTKRLTPKGGDIVITKTGRVGASAIIPSNVKVCIGRNQVILRANKKLIEPHYMWHYLQSSLFKKELKKLTMTGTILESLHVKYVPQINISLPSLIEQKRIAQFLDAISYKIKLNQQMNKTLEAIGQALFRRWFVDFEFLNEKGKPYKSSGGKMVESELGEIPKGWKVGKLGDIGKIQPGFAFKSSNFVDEGYKLIKIKNIQNSVVDIINIESYLSEDIFNKVDKKFILESGDILIAMTGAKLGKIGIIPKTKDKMLLNQRVGKVVSKNPFLFYFYLISQEIQGYFKGISSASSAQGNISNSDIEEIKIIVPNNEIINKFTDSTKSLFKLWIDNLQQNQKLSKIRDLLLPKLMSGEIRVR